MIRADGMKAAVLVFIAGLIGGAIVYFVHTQVNPVLNGVLNQATAAGGNQ